MKNYTSASRVNLAPSERELNNRNLAYRTAVESIVLLKNDNILPLNKGKVALFGAGASHTVKGGTGSGEVNERYSVSILDGLVNNGFVVTTNGWIEEYNSYYNDSYTTWKKSQKLLQVIKSMPFFSLPCGRTVTQKDIDESNTDVGIYVVSRQAGEGTDKRIEMGEYDLLPEEVESIRLMSVNYAKTIVVINSGSSMNLSSIADFDVGAIIYYCQQGTEGGNALANLLCGNECFSGKLTDTWANNYYDIPFADQYSYLSGDVNNEYYKEGIFVGYRYFDTFNVKPRYHFGYGLSYATFGIVFDSVNYADNKFTVKATVTNTSRFIGKETVQLYVSLPKGTLPKEYQRLVGFAKTDLLAPDQSQQVTVTFDVLDLASYNEQQASFVAEGGYYVLRLGNSSDNALPVATINVTENIVTSKLRNVCNGEQVCELCPPQLLNAFDYTKLPCVKLTANDVKTYVADYSEPTAYHDKKVDEIMSRLTVNDMAQVCVGTGLLGLFSSEKLFTPGAVGRTTAKLYNKGLINVNLADGPAGLRLTRQAGLSKSGKLKMTQGQFVLEQMNYLPKFIISPFVTNGKKHTLLYQYATAFPVGTALAQTWNPELCYQVGKAVSTEMDEFDITYWLAPAINIHRNPLCGRNFEYLSEDPLLTGKIASAIVRGVQSINGNYATIKHFACNNQEINRNHSNSHVDERALREIYLKAFEIAVTEGNAKSVMTSYNLLNGTYTANIYDLVSDVLRCEWGFDGVVMTDWLATGKGVGSDVKAIEVGNDLIMPGSKSASRQIVKAVKQGKLSYDKLYKATANIVRSIVYSNVTMRQNRQITTDMFD